jgi:hypothetical protein
MDKLIQKRNTEHDKVHQILNTLSQVHCVSCRSQGLGAVSARRSVAARLSRAWHLKNPFCSFIYSCHLRVQNATIPCRSQELLAFLSVMYYFLPRFSTNYSSILSHLILPSICWSTSQSFCLQIHKKYFFGIYKITNITIGSTCNQNGHNKNCYKSNWMGIVLIKTSM